MGRMSTNHCNLDMNYISAILVTKVCEKPSCEVSVAKQLVYTELEFEISYQKAWYSLRRCRDNIFGTWESSIAKLPKYMKALQMSNPGTIVEWQSKPMNHPSQKVIKYVFWAFKPCLDGPRNTSLLRLQGRHRSSDLGEANIDDVVRARRADHGIWTLFPAGVHPHPRVMQLIYTMGFYGVYRCRRMKVDFHLITALIERWREETHTFHFRIGEATITLQDIALLWGLPINGIPVIGTDYMYCTTAWIDYCKALLGFHP
ncbi:PREDICTED: serine/threonine-protein phosphatase 7 long form homolog [Erythranthe guttata]|uniref:serine/threonine-protein phosphatase 7 long form homolog n=1 Tax=Erythranthe guttata TaxID=4155 RepID=UPI00064DCED4|nr:PREDICTED: serine/threonine-protein phosphatase 7 long form homolog [Erythranthe guttata]|eukprot:XP_012851867.1 PREDICTED: serine/threonine-protein phosphatase 7 long form homolog [Erythranthe guttata]